MMWASGHDTFNSFSSRCARVFVRYVSGPDDTIGERQRWTVHATYNGCIGYSTQRFCIMSMSYETRKPNLAYDLNLSPQHRQSLGCRRPQCHSTTCVSWRLTHHYVSNLSFNMQSTIIRTDRCENQQVSTKYNWWRTTSQCNVSQAALAQDQRQ